MPYNPEVSPPPPPEEESSRQKQIWPTGEHINPYGLMNFFHTKKAPQENSPEELPTTIDPRELQLNCTEPSTSQQLPPGGETYSSEEYMDGISSSDTKDSDNNSEEEDATYIDTTARRNNRLTREQRSEAARSRWAMIRPEERSGIAKRREENKTPGQKLTESRNRSEAARRVWENKTPAQRLIESKNKSRARRRGKKK